MTCASQLLVLVVLGGFAVFFYLQLIALQFAVGYFESHVNGDSGGRADRQAWLTDAADTIRVCVGVYIYMCVCVCVCVCVMCVGLLP